MMGAPKILLLESATEVCSVALSAGNQLLALRESAVPMQHAQNMGVFVQEVLAEANLSIADLNAIAVSIGPGSYTGLRIGAALAKGLAFSYKLPILPISSLLAIANLARKRTRAEGDDAWLVPMIDARRMEVYTAVYGADLEQISSAFPLDLSKNRYQNYFNSSKKVIYCGVAVHKTVHLLDSPTARFIELESSAAGLIEPALKMYQAGSIVDLAYFSPKYLKKPNITRSKKERF